MTPLVAAEAAASINFTVGIFFHDEEAFVNLCFLVAAATRKIG